MIQFFTNDSIRDAVFSLQVACEHLGQVEREPLHWKWVMVSLHNSLQGFMASALAGADAKDTFKDTTKDQRRMKAYDEGTLPKLLSFVELYKRIQETRYMGKMRGKALSPSSEQTEHMCLLNNIRNDLMHYFPNLLMCRDLTEWLSVIESGLKIIDFLCFESETIFPSLEDKDRIRNLLFEINVCLTRYESHFSD